MRSKSIRSSAPPALRIPTFDSMKRFSTVSTEYGYEHTGSEVELPTFTFGLDEGPPLILPIYLIDQIDAEGGIEQDRKTENASEIDRIDRNDCSRGEELLDGDFQVNGINGTFTNSSSIGEPDLHLHPQADSNVRSNIKHYTRHRSGPFQPQPRPISQLTTHTVDSVGVTALPTLRSRGLPDTHHARLTVDTTAKMLSTPSKAERMHKRKGSMMVLGEMLGALGRSVGKKSDGSDKRRNRCGKSGDEQGNELKIKEVRLKRTGSTLSCMALGGSPISKTDTAISPLSSTARRPGGSGCHGGSQPFTPSTPLPHITPPSTTSTTSHSGIHSRTCRSSLKTTFVPVYPPSSAYSPNTPTSIPRSTKLSKAEPTLNPTHAISSPSTSTNLLSSPGPGPSPSTPCPAPQNHHGRSTGPPLPLADLNHDPNADTALNTEPINTASNTNPLLPSPLDKTALPALQEIIRDLHAENERLRARLGMWK